MSTYKNSNPGDGNLFWRKNLVYPLRMADKKVLPTET